MIISDYKDFKKTCCFISAADRKAASIHPRILRWLNSKLQRAWRSGVYLNPDYEYSYRIASERLKSLARRQGPR